MDAVKYLKAKAKMTRLGESGLCKINCYDCPLSNKNNDGVLCTALEAVQPEKAVEIVEKWAAEHPMKTRYSEFLKIFPNAAPLYIDPCHIDTDMMDDKCKDRSCYKCREKYWSQEVDDE